MECDVDGALNVEPCSICLPDEGEHDGCQPWKATGSDDPACGNASLHIYLRGSLRTTPYPHHGHQTDFLPVLQGSSGQGLAVLAGGRTVIHCEAVDTQAVRVFLRLFTPTGGALHKKSRHEEKKRLNLSAVDRKHQKMLNGVENSQKQVKNFDCSVVPAHGWDYSSMMTLMKIPLGQN